MPSDRGDGPTHKAIRPAEAVGRVHVAMAQEYRVSRNTPLWQKKKFPKSVQFVEFMLLTL